MTPFEIDMPARFLMVPGSENHDFYEFLTFYFKMKNGIFQKFQRINICRPHVQNHSKKLPAMLK